MNWKKRVLEHRDYLLNEVEVPEEQLFGVFLYGSQNYNIETENSDVDTKAIYIPTLEEAILQKGRRVKEYKLPNGEHCELMDIRHWVDNLFKQNINFVETLFTEYCWINTRFENDWFYYFWFERESIARYDIGYGIMSAAGQLLGTLRKNPFNPKNVANAIRFKRFLECYVNIDIPYKDCIWVPDGAERDRMLELKSMTRPLSTSEEAEKIISEVEVFKERYKDCEFYKNPLIKAGVNRGILDIIGACDNEYMR